MRAHDLVGAFAAAITFVVLFALTMCALRGSEWAVLPASLGFILMIVAFVSMVQYTHLSSIRNAVFEVFAIPAPAAIAGVRGAEEEGVLEFLLGSSGAPKDTASFTLPMRIAQEAYGRSEQEIIVRLLLVGAGEFVIPRLTVTPGPVHRALELRLLVKNSLELVFHVKPISNAGKSSDADFVDIELPRKLFDDKEQVRMKVTVNAQHA